MRSIHKGEKFPCNLCDYEATQKSNLKTHITRVHGMQNNVCKFCKTELENRLDLENHVISVHEKDFQVCTYENCMYRAKTKVTNERKYLNALVIKDCKIKGQKRRQHTIFLSTFFLHSIQSACMGNVNTCWNLQICPKDNFFNHQLNIIIIII